MAVLLAVVAFVVSTAFAIPASAGETDTFSFRPEPLRVNGQARRTFTYDLPPGESVLDSVLLRNKTENRRRFRVYAADGTVDPETGKVTVAASGAEPQGVGKWIDVETSEVTLGPRAHEVIDFSIHRPESNETAGVGAIVAEELAEDPADAGIQVAFRVAIVIRLDGAPPDLLASAPALVVPKDVVPSTADVTTKVTNETLRTAVAEVRFSIEGLTGRLWQLDPRTVSVPPGETKEITSTWTTVPRWGGVFRPRVEVIWTGGPIDVVGTHTFLPPLWVIALAIGLIGYRAVRELARQRQMSAQAVEASGAGIAA